MVTTVTDNSPQSINTSLFSLDKEVQEIKKVTDKLSGINPEANVISVNGKQGIVELTASDVNALPDTTVIPTTTSELENTSGFITSSDSITGNAATATRAEQDADGNVITDTYATKAELGNKVDKVSGKGLSTNDFTNAEKEKLAGLGNYDDSAVKTLIANETSERKTADDNLQTQITANKSAIDTLNGTGTGSVQKTVTDEIAKVVANAPEDFDTLKEISDWIDTHEDSASAMNTQIQANKAEITSLKTEVAGKSDIGHKHSADDITSGTLPIARGGTGQTTQADINKAIVGDLEEGGSDVTDGTMFVSSYASDNGFADTNATNKPYKRKFSAVWNYIKGKISSVLGLTASNYGGKASTAGTADRANALAYRDTIQNADTFQSVMNNDGKWTITDTPSWTGSLYAFHAGGSQSGLMFRIVGNSSGANQVQMNYSIDSNRFGMNWATLINSENIGGQTVARATQDGNGNNIAGTYMPKSVIAPQGYVPKTYYIERIRSLSEITAEQEQLLAKMFMLALKGRLINLRGSISFTDTGGKNNYANIVNYLYTDYEGGFTINDDDSFSLSSDFNYIWFTVFGASDGTDITDGTLYIKDFYELADRAVRYNLSSLSGLSVYGLSFTLLEKI